MKTLQTAILCLVGATALLFFTQAIALADSTAVVASTAGAPMPTGYAALALVVLVLASWGVRKTTKVPFFHSTLGAAIAGLLSAVIPGLIQVVQTNGLSWAALEAAAVGGVLSFVASDNASFSSQEVQNKVVAMRLSQQTSPVPPPIRPGVFLPFVFLAGFMFTVPSCNTPGGATLAKCELGTLPSAAGTVIAQLVAIAFSGGNYQQQLETAGVQAAENNAGPQFNCAVAAVTKWLDSSTPHGEVTQARTEAVTAFKAYLVTHKPTACGPIEKLPARCVPMLSATRVNPRG